MFRMKHAFTGPSLEDRSLFLMHRGPLTRYVKLQVGHAPGMPRTFSPPPLVSDPDIVSRYLRHARAVMHVGTTIPWWRGKSFRHFRRMRNPQIYVSDKRPMLMIFHELNPKIPPQVHSKGIILNIQRLLLKNVFEMSASFC